MKLILLADIHANLTALQAVQNHFTTVYGHKTGIIHLGDCIDYGMRPNEVIDTLEQIESRMLVNLKGNHEKALEGFEQERFSSQRGRAANNHTKNVLTIHSRQFIKRMKEETCELSLCNRRILCVHGDLSDPYWGKMSEQEQFCSSYATYDYVISGHTHLQSFSCKSNRETGQHTTFINPGSVGQPRNGNPNAQYAVLDLKNGEVTFHAIPYNIAMEQMLYDGSIDSFYCERLSKGV